MGEGALPGVARDLEIGGRVGAQRPAPDLFDDIPWSTPAVLSRTLSVLKKQDVDGYLLPFWYDLDEAADLERLVWHLKSIRATRPEFGRATWKALVRIGLVREAA